MEKNRRVKNYSVNNRHKDREMMTIVEWMLVFQLRFHGIMKLTRRGMLKKKGHHFSIS